MLKIFTLLLSLTAFLAAVWIIVPAPAYFIWLFSVAASEWSLWIGAVSVTAIILGIYTAIYSSGKIWIISLIFAISAFVTSLFPLLSVLHIAHENNVRLSLGEYFGGLKNDVNAEIIFETQTFAAFDGKELKFDVYKPMAENDNNGAAIIVIHGGSWNAGNRSDFPHWNKWLAANGFTVFDIDYRLAPQPNYLTATGDVKCFVLYLKEHAAEYNISPERVALFGRSAGAHLALLAAYSADDSALPPGCSAKNQTENVRAVISFYAPVELLWAYDHPANEFVINGPQTLANFIGGNPHETDEMRQRFTLASPTSHVSGKTPPTLLVHGEKDQLVRSENLKFAVEKLNQFGVSHKSILIPYAQHGFDYNFCGWGSQITKSVMLNFLRENTAQR